MVEHGHGGGGDHATAWLVHAQGQWAGDQGEQVQALNDARDEARSTLQRMVGVELNLTLDSILDAKCPPCA